MNRSLLSCGVGNVAGYFYKTKGTFYLSPSIPSAPQHRLKERNIDASRSTNWESGMAKSVALLSNRLERY